jgi:hypothetical protein
MSRVSNTGMILSLLLANTIMLVLPLLPISFVSPQLADLHHSDPSISTFIIKTKDDSNNFHQFLDVGFGAPFS